MTFIGTLVYEGAVTERMLREERKTANKALLEKRRLAGSLHKMRAEAVLSQKEECKQKSVLTSTLRLLEVATVEKRRLASASRKAAERNRKLAAKLARATEEKKVLVNPALDRERRRTAELLDRCSGLEESLAIHEEREKGLERALALANTDDPPKLLERLAVSREDSKQLALQLDLELTSKASLARSVKRLETELVQAKQTIAQLAMTAKLFAERLGIHSSSEDEQQEARRSVSSSVSETTTAILSPERPYVSSATLDDDEEEPRFLDDDDDAPVEEKSQTTMLPQREGYSLSQRYASSTYISEQQQQQQQQQQQPPKPPPLHNKKPPPPPMPQNKLLPTPHSSTSPAKFAGRPPRSPPSSLLLQQQQQQQQQQLHQKPPRSSSSGGQQQQRMMTMLPNASSESYSSDNDTAGDRLDASLQSFASASSSLPNDNNNDSDHRPTLSLVELASM